MGVGQLGVHVKVELGVKGQFFVSHLNDAGTASLDDLATVNRGN